jgi:phosphomannomutase/phosphoglucomutase
MNSKINPHIFRAYDIRGLAITKDGSKPDLTPESIELIGKGIGTYMKRTYSTKNMIVGRDNRLHSPDLQASFIKGILSTGIDVVNVDIITSPMLYYAVCKFGADSGVNITASHNPKEYNGVKVVREMAHSVCGDELQKVVQIILDEDFEEGHAMESEKTDVFDHYKQDLTEKFKMARPLKVVIDAGNGTAGAFAPALFRALGCEVTELYCELDGTFPNHEANPEVEENMRELGETVRAEGADLGLGFDGDGDRVGVVDENGKHYSADFLILLLARDLLKHHPGSQIVFDVKVSKILIDEIEKLGGIPVMSATGHSFIETKMHEISAPLAGEISGHLFFGHDYYDYYGFDDAFFGAAKILHILSQSETPFSKQFDGLPQMFTTPEYKVPCPDDRKFKVVEVVRDHFVEKDPENCITIDGVRVTFDNRSWGAIRCSNTSPNLTLRFESNSPERLDEIKKIMYEQLSLHPEVDQKWFESSP